MGFFGRNVKKEISDCAADPESAIDRANEKLDAAGGNHLTALVDAYGTCASTLIHLHMFKAFEVGRTRPNDPWYSPLTTTRRSGRAFAGCATGGANLRHGGQI